MNHLDARARAIVDAARVADNPSQTDRERIRRGVAIQIAAGTVAASTAAVAGTMSLVTKVGWVVATVAVVGGGSVGAHKVWQARKAAQAGHTHDAMTEVVPRAAVPAPMPAPALDEVAATAAPLPSPASAEARPGRTEKTRRRASSTGSSVEGPAIDDSLNAEVAVLGRVREELRLGKPVRALDALAEYDRRFGKGMLAEERGALAAIATCQAQPGPAAQAKAESFIRSAPSSPLLERVREACVRAPDAVRP
jgi:hypothetical protein